MNISIDSIVSPPDIPGSAPSTAILSAIKPDMDMLVRAFGNVKKRLPIFMANVVIPESCPDICIAGPFMGAPYAVMIMESLIKWGVKKFVFSGWCGSLSEPVKIGAVFVPDSAIIDEGVSRHYTLCMDRGKERSCMAKENPAGSSGISVSVIDNSVSLPDPELTAFILKKCEDSGIHTHIGKIWTTDAPYMETPEKIAFFQERGALTVDMETSALFSVAVKRNVSACAVMVVSDELYSMKWKTGFNDQSFRTARKKLCDCLKGIF